ncbi:MAG TPA: hypothetical protein VJT68_03660 [Thermoleophilaceae bacterium]|nr:hypothetical protein [Thermoleophilaceae bacterium]
MLVAALVVALLVPAGAAAQARTTETATNGVVTAELSYVKRERGRQGFRFIEYRDFRVKISRAGVVLYDQPVGEPCDQFCTPTESALTKTHVGLRDVNADGEPEAIVDLFTGGASCCVLVLAYGYDALANTYRRATLDSGGGFVVRDLDKDGVLELVGDDFRFRGLFTCGACGPRPIRIWHYGLRRFEVVTTDFPGKIREHARRMRRFYLRVRRRDEAAFVKGALTPLAADLCLLDRCGRGFRVVRGAIRRGELDRRSIFDVSPLGTNYLRALKRFLRRTGYL